MTAISTAPSSLAPIVKRALAAAPPVVAQSGSLTFAKSNAIGVDSSVKLSDAGINSATTKFSLSLNLKTGQKYSFSAWFVSGGPTVTLVDSNGKKTAISMKNGFTIAKSGTYQLVLERSTLLAGALQNISLNAKSLLPTTSGDKRIDALLMGGTDEWWHASDTAVTKSSNLITPTAAGLDANSSATALTFSFLSTAHGSAADQNGFQEMTVDQKNAVRRAFQYYGKIINVTFTEAAGDGTGDINFGANNQKGVSAGYAYIPNTSPTPGKTYLYLANDQSTNLDSQQLNEGGYGWETILHEIGHTLGLKHPGNYNAGGGGTPGPYLSAADDNRQNTIMSYKNNSVSTGLNPTTAMGLDVAALQYLYGANTSGSTATNGAFSFTAGNNYLESLWSTNGTDTIDLSGLTKSSNVNLNAGTFSSINITAPAKSTFYSGNNNVFLAYGAQVNNVTLSSTDGVAESVTLNNAFKSGSYDSIASVNAADDKIVLSKSLFGSLTAKNIEFGASATKSTSKIVVNSTTGEIFYDADGSGKGAAKKIAQYTVAQGHGQLSASNFSFVA